MTIEELKAEVNAAYLAYYDAFVANDLEAIESMVSSPFGFIGPSGVQLSVRFPFDPAELRRAEQWHRTVNEHYEVVAASPTNAHLLLRYAERIRADGSLIETVSGFYPFTRTAKG